MAAALLHDVGQVRGVRLRSRFELTEEAARPRQHRPLRSSGGPPRARARAPRGAAALHPHPPRRRRAAPGRGPAAAPAQDRLAGGPGALPPERARRRSQGRPRARPRPGRLVGSGSGRKGRGGRAAACQQRQGGEGELWRSLADFVCDDDADRDSQRRERADHETLARSHVAVALLAPGGDDRDRHDRQERSRFGLDLAARRGISSARAQAIPPPTPSRPPSRPPTPQRKRPAPRPSAEHRAHGMISSSLRPTRTIANSSEIARSGMRCWRVVPSTAPPMAGFPPGPRCRRRRCRSRPGGRRRSRR